jgi:hypothetical protein
LEHQHTVFKQKQNKNNPNLHNFFIGLVHAVYELYGATICGQMISCLGRLFTGYLQSVGFTCGIDDMLVKDHAEKNRQKSIEKSEKLGISVAEEFTGTLFVCFLKCFCFLFELENNNWFFFFFFFL